MTATPETSETRRDDQWMREALCSFRGEPIDCIDQPERAKALADHLCAACPVVMACHGYARANRMSGLWGGFMWDFGRIVPFTRRPRRTVQMKSEPGSARPRRNAKRV